MSIPRPRAGSLLVPASLLIGAFIFGCAGADNAEDAEIVVAVKVAAAVREPITATATASGGVFARREAVISTPVAGKLVNLEPIQNTTVKSGQVLAVLDAVDYFQGQKDLRQAQAGVNTLEALAVRRRALFEGGGIAKKDLEETELALSSARDDLDAAQRTLSAMSGSASVDASGRATVRAPFAGVITQQMQYGGEYVGEGTPLFKMMDLTGFVVKARFPDTIGALLTEGSTATVEDEAFGEPVTGTVSMVSRTSDPGSRTMEVWVTVENDAPGVKLRAGDAATVTAPTISEPDALVVPSEAVQLLASNGRDGTVMVVDKDNVAHETRVTIGIRAAGRTQIAEGLNVGDRVVTEGNYALPDATKVSIEAAEPEAAPEGAPAAPEVAPVAPPAEKPE